MNQYQLPGYKFNRALSIRWGDLDMFGHVNNSVYLTYAEQARWEYTLECLNWNWDEDAFILARAEVDFKAPLEVDDKAFYHVKTNRLGNSSIEIETKITRLDFKTNQLTEAASVVCILVLFDYEAGKSYPLTPEMRQKFYDFEDHLN